MKINGYALMMSTNNNPIGIGRLSGYCDIVNPPHNITTLHNIRLHCIYLYGILTRPVIQNYIVSDKFEIVTNTSSRTPVTSLYFNIIDNVEQFSQYQLKEFQNALFLKLTDVVSVLQCFITTTKDREYIISNINISLPCDLEKYIDNTPLYCEYVYVNSKARKVDYTSVHTHTGWLECKRFVNGYYYKLSNGDIITDSVLPVAYYRKSTHINYNQHPIIPYDGYYAFNDKPLDIPIKLGRPLRFKFGHTFTYTIDTNIFNNQSSK